MVQSLEQYVAEATNAYKPAQTAIQNQINALAGNLETTNQQINKNYAQQQATLNRNRNAAAETASMQAAGSGGSFGGAANIANRKYYDQTFVPAVTQLQTNQANELAQAKQSNENERTSLNSQLSNLQSQANQQALAQYYADLEAEREREFQRQLQEQQLAAQRAAAAQAAAAQNSSANYLMQAMKAANNKQDKSNVDFTTWLKNYSGYSDKTKNTLLNGINAAYKAKGALGNTMQNYLAKSLQNSVYYKQYLKWRNS